MSDPREPTTVVVGCYSLHVYCQDPKHADRCFASPQHPDPSAPGEFTGETRAECKRSAREAGWYIGRHEKTATCPRCNRAIAGVQG